jgi:hypothetical protein
MSTAPGQATIPSVEEIDRELLACAERIEALKRLRRAAVALARAEQTRKQASGDGGHGRGVAPCA